MQVMQKISVENNLVGMRAAGSFWLEDCIQVKDWCIASWTQFDQG
jgi:hypothetical protein